MGLKLSHILHLIILGLVLFGCMNPQDIKEAKIKSEDLIEKIAAGDALKEFPEKYFNTKQTEFILNEIKNKCDFANRKGHFINDFTMSDNGHNRVAFIYEYYLKCDSLRMILTYNLDNEIELYGFNVEPIEKDNFMIKNQERRLKF